MRVRPMSGLAVVLVLALLSSGVPVLANHTQSSGGKSVAFDHVTGNEWWVEVALSGPDASTVSTVEAQDTNGPWTTLAKKSWGPYAASFHIEPGNTVRFRATFPGGAQVVSCLFTHPAGVEQCGTTSTTTTTTVVTDPCEAFGTCGSFDATFKSVRGNEWWVQANVAGPNLAKVEATVDGGATFKALAKQSWGGYAASFRIVQGSTVQFKATSSSGATDLSSCYRWIPANGNTDASVVPCPGSTTSSTTTTTSSTTTTTGAKAWSTRSLGDIDGFNGPLVAEDLNADGRGDVLLLGQSGLQHLRPTGPVLLDSGIYWQSQVADADNDGNRELYVFGTPSGQESDELRQLEFDGNMVIPRILFGSYDQIGPFQIIDLDGDGRNETYVAHGRISADGERMNATIDFVPVGPTFIPPSQALDLGDAGNGFLGILAFDSGTVDGVPTLFALAITFAEDDGIENQVFAIRSEEGALHAELVGTFLGDPMLLAAGDIDADGTTDLVSGNMTDLVVFQEEAGAWTKSASAPVPAAMLHATFGDGDGDGKSEFYVGADDGRIYVLGPTSTGAIGARAIATVARPTADLFGPLYLTIGNGDADTTPEIYSLVYLFSEVDISTRVLETTFADFDATFTGVKGNNWWVQANVAGTQPISGVDARVNCGAWKPLAKQSWGGWAASFNVPSGSKVDFRATTATGATDLSGGYLWPNATPTTSC